MLAAEQGHDAVVKQLLAAGADVNIQTKVLKIVFIVDTNIRIVVIILNRMG
jgi:ankyrin repeat protein